MRAGDRIDPLRLAHPHQFVAHRTFLVHGRSDHRLGRGVSPDAAGTALRAL